MQQYGSNLRVTHKDSLCLLSRLYRILQDSTGYLPHYKYGTWSKMAPGQRRPHRPDLMRHSPIFLLTFFFQKKSLRVYIKFNSLRINQKCLTKLTCAVICDAVPVHDSTFSVTTRFVNGFTQCQVGNCVVGVTLISNGCRRNYNKTY